jgi:hypothetical protein
VRPLPIFGPTPVLACGGHLHICILRIISAYDLLTILHRANSAALTSGLETDYKDIINGSSGRG